jgi:hypothetical protein
MQGLRFLNASFPHPPLPCSNRRTLSRAQVTEAVRVNGKCTFEHRAEHYLRSNNCELVN